MLSGNYHKLFNSLKEIFPDERLFSDELKTFAYGTDASFYRLTPKIVVKVNCESEVLSVIKICSEHNIPITFRASGTSLSGQSITDSVLVVADRSWNKVSVSDDHSHIIIEPAALGSRANLELSKFNKKIGPDPASINAATVIGIAVNNASGMTSGVKFNSYNTIKDMKIIFANGTQLDTSNEGSKNKFIQDNRDFLIELLAIAGKIKSNSDLTKKIKDKYAIKNTTGYGVNSLVDFDDPIEIIKHLMIGSEGTLGFISEITFNTVPSLPYKGTSLIIFPNIEKACEAIPILTKMPVNAAEIMDRAALKSVENKSGLPTYLKSLDKSATALLIETSALSEEKLFENIKTVKRNLILVETVFPIKFTTNKEEYLKLWDVRKGLFPSVSKSRKSGTTIVIEDVNFETTKLANAVSDLQQLFTKHNYTDTIIWGHALSGNIHFVFAQDFNLPTEIQRYKDFMNEIVELVIKKYDGSLKAEHGTGRNMAPFVRYEWGEEINEIMCTIKRIFDPNGILNPGVLINNDAEVHIKNLKPTPIVNSIIDKCIDCGFCENVCPSKDLTLTPRQRISVWREISNLRNKGINYKRFEELSKSYIYDGEQTCATDGLCELACPVDIDTGNLVKQIRNEHISQQDVKYAKWMADNIKLITTSAKHGLNIVSFLNSIMGDSILHTISSALNNLSNNKLPVWTNAIPSGSKYKIGSTNYIGSSKTVVYFPSCISRSMGTTNKNQYEDSQTTVMERLFTKSGYNVVYPKNINSLCCGMPFSSKGYFDLADYKSAELEREFLSISKNGKYPIVFDTSPCTKTFDAHLNKVKDSQLKVYDSVEFIHDVLLEKLNLKKKTRSIAVHSTCSTTKMGQTEKLIAIANACVTDVNVPEDVHCCGFAGDRGFNYPELNESALKNLKLEVEKHHCSSGYSSSKTCEIGLSLHAGIDYNSIAYLVDECSN